jgi:hypothetical protein
LQIKTCVKWISQFVFAATLLSVLLIQAGFASATQVPTISPSGGEYTSSETVTIGNIDSGDTAYYTTDGSNPKTSSTAVTYSGTFTVSQSEIVRAAIKDSSGDWSSITTAVFIIDSSNSTSLDAPTISPSGGKYTSSETVTISNYSDGTAYYTTDKSDPRTSSTATEYGGSFTVSESEIVLAAVKDSSGDWSKVTAARFIIDNSSNSNYDNNGSNTNYDNNDSNDSNNWYNGSGSGSGNRNGNRNQGLDYNVNNWDKNLDKNW